MILTVLYADGTEEGYSVSPNTKIREALRDDFFYISTLEGGQVAIAASAVEKISLGNVDVNLAQDTPHGRPDDLAD